MRRLLFLAVLFFPCTVSAFWPLSWELGNEKRYVGPLASYSEDEEGKHFIFRPFLLSYDTADGGDCRYLYPLGKISPESSYFLPIYRSRKNGTESDAAFLLFFGGTSAKGNYGGFFPVYGKLYNRFAKDEIGFVAWPFYSYTKDEGAEKTDILYPFFSFYGGTDQGFKTWPVYSDHNRLGNRRKQFFAWPFVFKEEKNLDTDDPVDSLMILPFYVHSRSQSGAMEYKGVLWPFFTYSKNSSREKWNFPWPFFSKTKGETTGYDYFPFIAREKNGTDSQFSLLWPIYREHQFFVKGERFSEKSIMAINRYMEDDRGTFLNVWPFFEYEKKNEDSTFLFPAILPFRYKEMTKIMKPVITLYEQSSKDGARATSVLYGLYTYQEIGESWKTRFAFLLELKKDDGGAGFELFSGLFGVDAKKIKLFFIPIDRSSR